MALPSPPDRRSLGALNVIYQLLLERGTWPSFVELDRRLDLRGEPDAEGLLVRMPTGLLVGVSSDRQPIPDDQEIALTVAGLASCDDSDACWTIDKKILTAVPLPAAGRADVLTRLGEILRVEPWGWSGRNRQEQSWSFTVDRRVRRLRGVRTIKDYWAHVHGDPREGSGSERAVDPEAGRSGTEPSGVRSIELPSSVFTARPRGKERSGERLQQPIEREGSPSRRDKGRLATRHGHAFISYVHEDKTRVDLLEEALESAGILVWRDTADLWPGENWRLRIREAITEGALAFIACFSTHLEGKSRSYQREELAQAAEEQRLRPPGSSWPIPVRLDDCALPSYNLGAGLTLDDLQRIDLFGGNWELGTQRLVTSVRRILSSDPDLRRPTDQSKELAFPLRTDRLPGWTASLLVYPESRQMFLDLVPAEGTPPERVKCLLFVPQMTDPLEAEAAYEPYLTEKSESKMRRLEMPKEF